MNEKRPTYGMIYWSDTHQAYRVCRTRLSPSANDRHWTTPRGAKNFSTKILAREWIRKQKWILQTHKHAPYGA